MASNPTGEKPVLGEAKYQNTIFSLLLFILIFFLAPEMEIRRVLRNYLGYLFILERALALGNVMNKYKQVPDICKQFVGILVVVFGITEYYYYSSSSCLLFRLSDNRLI